MDTKNVSDEEVFLPDKMSKVSLFETPRFFCDIYCLQPGQSQKIHSHEDNDKIYYVLRGSARVTVGEESQTLEAGEIVLAPAEVPHGVSNETDAEAVCLVFMAPHPRLR